ncbi:unnamed protein product, partial [Vitis vinifera]|uniref:beta-galactosidase n=1 Tax=Vitis vinifera TaxID=29760 RepID=D7T5Z9_VITVI
MWSGLVKTAKEGGIDVIEIYVFWNGHELSPGTMILLWGMVRSSQVCEDCSAGWDVFDSPYWSICCCRMGFPVCRQNLHIVFFIQLTSLILPCLS